MSGLLDVGDGDKVYWESTARGSRRSSSTAGPGPAAVPITSSSSTWRGIASCWSTSATAGRAGHMQVTPPLTSVRTRPHTSSRTSSACASTSESTAGSCSAGHGAPRCLAYAETHPERVSALVVFGVTTGRHCEFDWLFRGGVSLFFPHQWERLAAHVSDAADVPAAYDASSSDRDPDVRRRAMEEWIRWESATPHWPPREGLSDVFDRTSRTPSPAGHALRPGERVAPDGELLGPTCSAHSRAPS